MKPEPAVSFIFHVFLRRDKNPVSHVFLPRAHSYELLLAERLIPTPLCPSKNLLEKGSVS